jgi:hypothetical protein
MTEKPVLEQQRFEYRAVTEAELEEALEYARHDRPAPKPKKGARARKAYVGQELDRDLLRILGNSALERRKEGSILPLLAASVVREAVPSFKGSEQDIQRRYESYKCAVMKIMSIRRVWQMKQDAEKRRKGIPIPSRTEQTQHPDDTRKRHKGQIRLFS